MARSSALRWGRAALVLALAACHSAGPLPRTARPRFVDLTGKLQLIDARPVPRATLAVACGKVRLTVTTDSKGRFALPGVPEGTCRISCPLANIDQEVRASANLIGRTAGVDLVLTVPPMHRMEIKVAGGGWAMDETLVAWIPPAIDRGDLLRRTPRPWMPLAFRNAPRGGEMGKIPLLDPDRHLTTLDLSAPRTALYLAPCNKSGSKIALDLQRLVESHAATGLRGVAIQTRPCRQGQPLPSNALAGSAEVLWALQARPGDVVLLDRGGNVLLRAQALERVVAYLEQSWPPFAAVRQVSVQRSVTVRDAETRRLYSQASEQVRARRYAEAHGLLDQTLQLDPEHAEAHRERAILKARLGDLSGAMREVTWWRGSFGEESAEDLLDEIQRVTASR